MTDFTTILASSRSPVTRLQFGDRLAKPDAINEFQNMHLPLEHFAVPHFLFDDECAALFLPGCLGISAQTKQPPPSVSWNGVGRRLKEDDFHHLGQRSDARFQSDQQNANY